MEPREVLAIVVFFALLIGLGIYNYSALQSAGEAIISGGVIQNFSVSLTIVASQTDTQIPASGNVTFGSNVSGSISKITNLTQSSGTLNLTLWGDTFQYAWAIPEPNSSQKGNLTIEYFEIKSNYSESHSRLIYFSVAQSELGSVSPKNISLFVYKTDTNWTSLPTYIISGTADPATFYAVATNFSFFLIAQKPTGAAENGDAEEISPAPSPSPGGSTGGGGGGGRGIVAPVPEEILEELPEEVPELPFPIKRKVSDLFDVEVLIPEEYREVAPGSELPVEVRIINTYPAAPLLLEVYFTVEDKKEKVYYEKKVTQTVDLEANFIEKVTLPAYMRSGHYVFYARVIYDGEEALAGATFYVSAPAVAGLAAARPVFPTAAITVETVIGAVLLLLILVLLGLVVRRRFLRRSYVYKPRRRW